jgi:hypothetical protein
LVSLLGALKDRCSRRVRQEKSPTRKRRALSHSVMVGVLERRRPDLDQPVWLMRH